MTNGLIAFAGPGLVEWIIVLIVFGIPLVLVVLLVKYTLRERRENIRLRLEVGKLADEVQIMRQKLKPSEKGSVDKIE